MPATTLVIQTAFLGDVVLTTPLLTVLAERSGPVDVVTTPAAAPLLESHPAVARVIRYDKRGADRGLRGLIRLGARLRRAGYQRVLLPHRSWRSAALALLSRAAERVGFADAPAALSYTRRVPRPAGVHETQRLLALGGSGATAPVSLGITDQDQAGADEWLAARGIGPGFVAIAPGSIWGTKRWPGYPELVRQVDRPVVVVGSAADRGLADQAVQVAPDRTHSAAGELPLRASAALLRRAAVLVTNDSAPLHLATAVGTPVIALFGPTVPAFGFGPLGPDDSVLEVPLPCRPCSAHGPQRCPLGHHRCMTELEPAVVARAVARLTSQPEAPGALRPRD